MAGTPSPSLKKRLKSVLPRTLFARTLLIIFVPLFLAQSVATFVFYDRHWQTVTNRLAYAVAGDIALGIHLIESTTTPAQRSSGDMPPNLTEEIRQATGLTLTFTPKKGLPFAYKPGVTYMEHMLLQALAERVPGSYAINPHVASETVAIYIARPEGLYTTLSPESRLWTPTAYIFILWMVGSAMLLFTIALVFMRNQIRPLWRLAEAAERFGRGQDVPHFKLEGAREVRQVAAAFQVMKNRLRRQIDQRTAMLAAVSHDLRTPLTRMRLELALAKDENTTKGLSTDIAEMERMIEAYLAFARGEEGETAQEIELGALVNDVVQNARRAGQPVRLIAGEPVEIMVRPQAIARAVANLVGNAARYGTDVEVAVAAGDYTAEITVDDNGPGIPAAQRDKVFKAFFRLENTEPQGGVGLGLAIARDIARAHGGDIALEKSHLGGLRAILRLPL